MTELRTDRFPFFKAWLLIVIGGTFVAGSVNVAAQNVLPTNGRTEAAGTNTRPNAERTAVPSTSSAWGQLTPMQRQALAPLGAQWGALTALQQAKWLTISKNFTQLPLADQITMHSRMADWVDLSPQQRNLARLNFNQMQSLPKEDKKAKWEAYQALPAEEKRLLSERTPSLAKSAAPTIKPLEAHRQVQTPARTSTGISPSAVAIDRKTLLPRLPSIAAPTQGQALPTSADVPESIKPNSEAAPS